MVLFQGGRKCIQDLTPRDRRKRGEWETPRTCRIPFSGIRGRGNLLTLWFHTCPSIYLLDYYLPIGILGKILVYLRLLKSTYEIRLVVRAMVE